MPYFPASSAAWCGHVTEFWPMKCKHKWCVVFPGRLFKGHDSALIFSNLSFLFPSKKKKKKIRTGVPAAMDHEVTWGMKAKDGGAKILNPGLLTIPQSSRPLLKWVLPRFLMRKTKINFNLKKKKIIYLGALDLSCSMWTLGWGMWDLVPWPGIKPMPPALGVGVLAPGLAGKCAPLDSFASGQERRIGEGFGGSLRKF